MNFDHKHYVPWLRWKQGEYQAVFRLKKETKEKITPFIEVSGFGYDFENKTESKSIDELLKPFAKRIIDKWGKEPCFVDLKVVQEHEKMKDGTHPADFVFSELFNEKCQVVPVVGLDSNQKFKNKIQEIVKKNKIELCLRIQLEQVIRETFRDDIGKLLAAFSLKPSACHFVLDLGTPNFSSAEGFSSAIVATVNNIAYLNEWKTFTILSTSVPERMSQGTIKLPRGEWTFFKALIPKFKKMKMRLPTFGDYTASHPNIINVDLRILKSAAKIIYSIDDEWLVVKGTACKKKAEFKQFNRHSKTIVESGSFCGEEFSWADKFISDCSKGGKTGNKTTWKQVYINHHIEKVVHDLANFSAS